MQIELSGRSPSAVARGQRATDRGYDDHNIQDPSKLSG
jgi:hypothetical protein